MIWAKLDVWGAAPELIATPQLQITPPDFLRGELYFHESNRVTGSIRGPNEESVNYMYGAIKFHNLTTEIIVDYDYGDSNNGWGSIVVVGVMETATSRGDPMIATCVGGTDPSTGHFKMDLTHAGGWCLLGEVRPAGLGCHEYLV